MFTRIRSYMSLESYIACAVIAALGWYWGSSYSLIAQYTLISIIVLGTLPLLYEIVTSIMRKEFGVDLIALLAIASATLIGEYGAAGLILLMLSGGEALERYAEGKARSSLKELLEHMPTHAHVVEGERITEVPLADVQLGQIVLVRPQEVVSVDGTVHLGTSVLDESMITGEPVPRDVSVNARVYAGSVNQGESIHVSVEKLHAETTYASIVRLIRSAEASKAPLVRLADQYSVVFTFITLLIAGVAYFWFESAYLMVAVLVVATPCPLILAAPIAFVAGMSRAAQRGIIVKHGGVFEGISRSRQFFFDKTGTLTFGIPQVARIHVAGTFSELDVLRYAASLEQLSTHIIARGVVQYARAQAATLSYPEHAKEQYGYGIEGVVSGRRVLLGKAAFLSDSKVSIATDVTERVAAIKKAGGIVVYVAIDGVLAGVIECEDTIRPDVAGVMQSIAAAGFHTTLVTGDSEERARSVQAAAGVESVVANCLPDDKVKLVQKMESEGQHVVMVGDGINDAPALAAATVGIALGAHGETASTESAHAVIMVDDISRVKDLLDISLRTMFIARQSILAGIILSVCAMIAALFGYLPPVMGAFIQEGIDVAVILNALRVLYK